MGNKPTGRQHLSDPQREQREQRRLLFEVIQKMPRYRVFVKTNLGRLWQSVRKAPPPWNFGTILVPNEDGGEDEIDREVDEVPFPALERAACATPGTVLDPYIAAIRHFTVNVLHLVRDGEPLDWAEQAIHGHVVGPDVGADFDADWYSLSRHYPTHKASLHLEIAPNGAEWRLEVVGEPIVGVPNRHIAPAPLVFDPTDPVFEARLQETLQPWLERVRAELEVTGGVSIRRPSRNAKWPSTARQLASILVHGQYDYNDPDTLEVTEEALRKRVDRMAAMVGVDPRSARTISRRKAAP